LNEAHEDRCANPLVVDALEDNWPVVGADLCTEVFVCELFARFHFLGEQLCDIQVTPPWPVDRRPAACGSPGSICPRTSAACRRCPGWLSRRPWPCSRTRPAS